MKDLYKITNENKYKEVSIDNNRKPDAIFQGILFRGILQCK